MILDLRNFIPSNRLSRTRLQLSLGRARSTCAWTGVNRSTRAQIVNSYAAAELERIFRDYGEEPQARRLARAIVDRAQSATASKHTDDLARLIERIKGRGRRDHHPATQVFQALRIAVNQELRQLERFLESGYELCCRRGAWRSFHFIPSKTAW